MGATKLGLHDMYICPKWLHYRPSHSSEGSIFQGHPQGCMQHCIYHDWQCCMPIYLCHVGLNFRQQISLPAMLPPAVEEDDYDADTDALPPSTTQPSSVEIMPSSVPSTAGMSAVAVAPPLPVPSLPAPGSAAPTHLLEGASVTSSIPPAAPVALAPPSFPQLQA
jgi:hypothetical protein